MDVQAFMELFIQELALNSDLSHYYKLLDNPNRFLFRKAYLEQRLQFILAHAGNPGAIIWDAGCGYATTAIFLTLNGYRVLGTTLEFYYDKISRRLEYWSKYGNVDAFQMEYANLFDKEIIPGTFDTVITQDTLHHLEPVGEALAIFYRSLRQGGRLVVIEENGNCIFINLKNFFIRGLNKTTSYYDEKLDKHVLFGNENARSFGKWLKIIDESGFFVDREEVEYMRFFPPFLFRHDNYAERIKQERIIGRKPGLLREMFFFGINFWATKSGPAKNSSG
jgi:SAM-dependent methyltransferase